MNLVTLFAFFWSAGKVIAAASDAAIAVFVTGRRDWRNYRRAMRLEAP